MAEQYVYVRGNPERGNINGFTCRTAGVVGAVQREISTLTSSTGHVKNVLGEYIPIWEKVTLSGKQDKVILQRTEQFYTADGLLRRASGYVLDLGEALLTHPTAWLGLSYHIQPEQLSLAPNVVELLPLPQVLTYYQISQQQLLQLLKSCFDARLNDRITLIAVDYTTKEDVSMGDQLLLWIYSLLPFTLRRELNCTTCYEGKWGTRYHLGLVPMQVLEAGKKSRGIPGDVGTIFYRGRIEYNPGTERSDADLPDGIFIQWLRTLIAQLVEPDRQHPGQLLQKLDGIYRRFDRMISSLPEEDRFKPQYHDALCWSFARQGQSGKVGPFTREELNYFEDLLAFGSWPEVLELLEGGLDALECSISGPASSQVIRLLTKLILLDAPDATLHRAREMLSACLARDMEAAEIGESSAVSARYMDLMVGVGMERAVALQYLGCTFFPSEFPSVLAESRPTLWENLGTSRLPREGLRRCNDWMSSYVNVCLNAEELVDCADTVIRELEGLSIKLLEQALDCLLGAQETRCYYAKLEVLPAHLALCTQCRNDVWKHRNGSGQAVLEHYYDRLLQLLCRQYVSYWTGRNTLTAVCGLSANLNRWDPLSSTYLRELALSQCADICEYDWEKLKEQLDTEQSDLLEKLYQALELLEQLGGNEELRNQLCRQVCRYLLHRVPDYINADWLVSQVREQTQLNREGYYLELLTVRDFLQGKEQTLERLQLCIKARHLPAEFMNDMMKFLYRVFQQGGLPHLSPMAVEGFYIANRDRLKVSQLDVFRAICRVRGGKAFLSLLHCWPTSPLQTDLSPRQRKAAVAAQRTGAYAWLKVTPSLMEALDRLSQDQETLTLAARENPAFYLQLADAIDAMVPVGTRARPTAATICQRLLTLQEQDASLKTRMICSTRRRRLTSESKG